MFLNAQNHFGTSLDCTVQQYTCMNVTCIPLLPLLAQTSTAWIATVFLCMCDTVSDSFCGGLARLLLPVTAYTWHTYAGFQYHSDGLSTEDKITLCIVESYLDLKVCNWCRPVRLQLEFHSSHLHSYGFLWELIYIFLSYQLDLRGILGAHILTPTTD